MKNKKMLKILWIFVICLAFLSSCVCMDSNALSVSAEDTTESETETVGEWEEFLVAISGAITALVEAPTPEKGVLLGIQYAIANTEPIRTAGDVTVFNDCSVYTFDYTFRFTDDTTVYRSGVVGSEDVYVSDALVSLHVHQYPNGSTALANFSDSGRFYSRITASAVEIIGTPSYAVSYTEPLETISSTNPSYPFKLLYSDVTLRQQYFQSSSNLGHFTSAVIGDNIVNSPNSSMENPERIFVLPPANESQDLNSYLETVYTKYETTYGTPFEYEFPDLIPTGVRLPDGSITGDSGDSDIVVNVEFPTYNVPDYPEPDVFTFETIPEVSEHEISEIPESALLGLEFWWECSSSLLTLFNVWDLTILVLWVGLICFLLWR